VKHVTWCRVDSFVISEDDFVFGNGFFFKDVLEGCFFVNLPENSALFIFDLFEELLHFSPESWSDKVFIFGFECNVEVFSRIFEEGSFDFFDSAFSVIFEGFSVFDDQCDDGLFAGVDEVMLLLFVLGFVFEPDQAGNP
jgi:hypothetical protein